MGKVYFMVKQMLLLMPQWFKLFILFCFCWQVVVAAGPDFSARNGLPQSTQALAGIPRIPYTLVESREADVHAFTQGLYLRGETLYLGTGLYGKSELRAIDWNTGTVLQRKALPRNAFGEGVTVVGDRIYQLTWKNGLLNVYDRDTFKLIKTLTYQGEGWGLTHNATHLIMSNGTAQLTFRAFDSFAVSHVLKVTANGSPIHHLNELEWVNGWILANRWLTHQILWISPETGAVGGVLDLSPIVAEVRKRQPRADVLNGIAYDPVNDLLIITGKLWDRYYLVKVDWAAAGQSL